MRNLFKTGWYVLYVRSRHERTVENLLKEKQLEPFSPMVKTIRQWSDRKKTIDVPLFPSYVFVKINSLVNFNKALSIEGACNYVRFGREYAVACEDEINRIKTLLAIEGLESVMTSDVKLTIGEKYKINYGVLNGLDCEIVRIDTKDKVVVSVDSLQKNIIATLPKYYLSDLSLAVQSL